MFTYISKFKEHLLSKPFRSKPKNVVSFGIPYNLIRNITQLKVSSLIYSSLMKLIKCIKDNWSKKKDSDGRKFDQRYYKVEKKGKR